MALTPEDRQKQLLTREGKGYINVDDLVNSSFTISANAAVGLDAASSAQEFAEQISARIKALEDATP